MILPPYAQTPEKSRGRFYKEEEHPIRSIYQRDRDRIIHSTSFRRLEYKTQVFMNYAGDLYRTRLTHTLEVSQIARTIAKALRLNEELVEAISLAHDIGHPPFGHAGEETLNELNKQNGGFEHNLHAYKLLTKIEKRYPEFDGLNLTYEVLEGIIKHDEKKLQIPSYYKILERFGVSEKPPLEAQIIEWADEIAYNTHDIEDGLFARIIQLEELNANVPLFLKFFLESEKKYPNISKHLKIRYTIRKMIDFLVRDIINQSEKNIKESKITSLEDVRKYPKRLIHFSQETYEDIKIIKKFLRKNLYNYYTVKRMSFKAKHIIRKLYEAYISEIEILPPHIVSRIKENPDKKEEIIIDFIAGMTDRYAIEEYKRLYDPNIADSRIGSINLPFW